MFDTEIGTIVRKSGNNLFLSKANRSGFVIFGPYVSLPKGIYVVKFDIEIHGGSKRDPVVCGRADVAINGAHIIAQTSLYTNRAGEILLPFRLEEAATVEYRIHSTGKVDLLAKEPVLVETDDTDTRYEPILALNGKPQNAFFKSDFGDFRFLYENGVNLTETEECVIGSFGPAVFKLNNLEDCQVVNEVYLTNEYNVKTDDPAIFIDIGMSSGLTSLQAAYKSNIVSVHSFEPFATPIKRARDNLDLNPDVADKIYIHPFGLSDRNENLEVIASPDHTIGTSIRGIDTGTPELITVKDAAESLAPIIENARGKNFKIIMKIDCEGSEFAIIDRLNEEKLLSKINVIMIEWHKWWLFNLDQSDLIRPLNDNGFIVLDRTTPANIFAGMLYAIKTAT